VRDQCPRSFANPARACQNSSFRSLGAAAVKAGRKFDAAIPPQRWERKQLDGAQENATVRGVSWTMCRYGISACNASRTSVWKATPDSALTRRGNS